MSDIVERLRKGIEWTGPTQDDTGQTENYMDEAADLITALRAEVERHQRSFDLRWDASMRAIKRWQEAHPGNDLNWPDHADLVVWLLERDAALRAEVERLRAALKIARPFIGWAGYYPTILAEVDAALEGPQDRMVKPLGESHA